MSARDVALKRALEALEAHADIGIKSDKAITAIKAALAQPDHIPGARKTIAKEVALRDQEPFGYFKAEPFGWTDCAETDEGATALYERPAPQERQPLTTEQILHKKDRYVAEPNIKYPLSDTDWLNFARAIEAAHGIKGAA